MKYLKKFEEVQINEDVKKQILEYLEQKYPEDWWNRELSDRVYDYCDEDDMIGSGDEDEPEFESLEDA